MVHAHNKMQQCMQGCNLLIIRFPWAIFKIILHKHKKIIFCYYYANNLKAITINLFFTELIQKMKMAPHRTKWITVLYHSLSGHYSCTLRIYLYKNNRMMQVLVSGTDASCNLQSETDAVSESHVCLILSSARQAQISYSSANNNKIHVHMMSKLPQSTLTKHWYSAFKISCEIMSNYYWYVFWFY